MTTEWSNKLGWNNSNNIYTVPKQYNTSIKLVAGRPTDRQSNIATYRAAIEAKDCILNWILNTTLFSFLLSSWFIIKKYLLGGHSPTLPPPLNISCTPIFEVGLNCYPRKVWKRAQGPKDEESSFKIEEMAGIKKLDWASDFLENCHWYSHL